mgnify:CR=1 FL=1
MQMYSWNFDTHWKTVKTSSEKNTPTSSFKASDKRVFKALCCWPKSKCWAPLFIITKINSKSPHCCSINDNKLIKTFRACSYKVNFKSNYPELNLSMYFVIGHVFCWNFTSTMMRIPQIQLSIITCDLIKLIIKCSTLFLYRLQTSIFFRNSLSSMRRFYSRFRQRY